MKKLENILSKTWIFAVLLSLPAAWALFVPGFYGASDDMHIAWLYQLDKVIKFSQFPPRFVPDLSFGFGYPLFNFIYPLPFYLAEVFHLLGLSFVDSIKALFFISIPLSVVSMYFLLREFTNKGLSLAGALIYVYAPYRAVDLYIRGAVGEIVAFMFLPLIALSVVKIARSENCNLRYIGTGALALASLALSHNITAYMFIPFVFLLAVLMIIFHSPKKVQVLISLILTVFLGLLISSCFWLPVIVESGLMKYDTVFNFADHFPTLRQLVTPYWGYGASVPGPYDGLPFFLGTINLAVLILGVFLAAIFWKKYSKLKKIFLIWAGISLLVAVFLMNFRSSFLWQNLPLLPYFQFPWRFLIMATFLMPIFIIVFEKFKFQKIVIFAIITLVIILNVLNFRPQDFLGREDGYYLNRYIPVPVASSEYLNIAEEYLRLPKDTEVRPDKNYPLVTSGDGEIKNITKFNDLNVLIETSSEGKMVINFNKYMFPGWTAKIDGGEVKITPGSPFGQINVEVPKGEHQVQIKFEETTFRQILNLTSLLAFFLAIYLIVKKSPPKLRT